MVSHFATILFTQCSKGYNCLVVSTIYRRASSVWSFFRQQPFRTDQCSSIQHSPVQLLQLTTEIVKKVLERWADSEKIEGSQHGVEDNVISCWTSYLDGCRLDGRKWMARVNSKIRENNLKWTISLERERPLSPAELSLR